MKRALSTDLRHRISAGAVSGLVGVAGWIPRPLAPRLGSLVGRLAYRLDGKRRRRALQNLEHAFAEELPPSERAAIAAGYYRHLGRSLLENAVVLRQHPRRPFRDFVHFENFELAREVLAEHGSVIWVTCHAGPWELLAASAAELSSKPIHSLYRPLKNPYLDQRLSRSREKLGLPTVNADDRRAVPTLLRLLGRDECVGILCDLDHKQNPVFVDFFGRPAATARLPGLLAVRSGKPLLCGYAWCTDDPYHYRAVIDGPFLAQPGADTDEEIERLTAVIVRSNEQFIRQHPEQWHWNYNRWRTRPQ